MKNQKVYLLMDSRRYHWKVGTTQRSVLKRLSELISRKGRKHTTLCYIELNTCSKVGAEHIAKGIQFKYEYKGASIIGNDYFVIKDNKNNIIKDFKKYSKQVCDNIKIEYEWYEC